MKSEQYYKSFLALFDYVIVDGNMDISLWKGTELCGEYWVEIRDRLRNDRMGVADGDGSFGFTQPQKLYPLHTEALHALEIIAKEKEDRALDRRSKETAIKYSKWALTISILALIMSAFDLLLRYL